MDGNARFKTVPFNVILMLEDFFYPKKNLFVMIFKCAIGMHKSLFAQLKIISFQNSKH